MGTLYKGLFGTFLNLLSRLGQNLAESAHAKEANDDIDFLVEEFASCVNPEEVFDRVLDNKCCVAVTHVFCTILHYLEG